MNVTSQRTQIILPKSLRDAIDSQRRLMGESMAEYVRIAAKERLAREKKKKTDLKKLAEEVIGSSKRSRTDKEIDDWIRQIRIDRQEDDAHRMRRLNEALEMPYPKENSTARVLSLRDNTSQNKPK